jgi:protease I
MELEGKSIAVLVEEEYQELELWYPVLRMREAGARVQIVGPSKGSFKSKLGYPATADITIDEARPEDFDGVIIPGGYAPDRMRRHPGMVRFVREIYERGRVVAAICHAGWLAASAGIVKGKTVTSFFSIKDDMVNAGARWVDQEVVVDGNLITSRVPGDLPAFCREVIRAVAGVRVSP